jgi:hypothetical protein
MAGDSIMSLLSMRVEYCGCDGGDWAIVDADRIEDIRVIADDPRTVFAQDIVRECVCVASHGFTSEQEAREELNRWLRAG